MRMPNPNQNPNQSNRQTQNPYFDNKNQENGTTFSTRMVNSQDQNKLKITKQITKQATRQTQDKWTNQSWWYLIILNFIAILSYWFWFFDWGMITAGDWGFLGPQASRELWDLPSMIGLTGRTNLTIQTAPIFALWGGLSYFFGFEVVSRLVYLFPSVFIPVIGMFVLGKHILKSDLAGFVASIVFNSSIYFLMIRQGHLLLACAYGMTVWVVYYFIRMMQEKKWWQAFALSFLAFLCGVFEFRGLYITLWLVFFYYLYYNLVEKRNWQAFWQTTKLSAVTFILFISYNIFWLLPFSQTEILSSNSLFERSIITSHFFDLIRAFGMFIIWWSGSAPAPTWNVPLNFFIAPIAAIFGFYYNRRNTKVVFFAIISLFGILLSKQAGDPFPDLYDWLYKNFAGFGAFREASKFYGIISLGYAILIASLVTWLVKNLNQTLWQRFFQVSLILVLVTSFLWHNRPMISQEYGALTVPKTIPAESVKFNNFIAAQEDEFYVLGVPTLDNWFSSYSRHRRLDLVNIVQDDWAKIMDNPVRSIENPWTMRELITYLLDKPVLEEITRQFGVKYLVLPKEEKRNGTSNQEALGGRQYFIDALQKSPFIKQIDIGSGDLLIFENTNYKKNRDLTEQVWELNSNQNINYKSLFVKNTLGGEFNIYLNDEKRSSKEKISSNTTPDLPTSKLSNLFENLKPQEINGQNINQNLEINPTFDYKIYHNQNRKEIVTSFENGKLEIFSQNQQNLKFNGQDINLPANKKVLFQQTLDPKETYYLTFQGKKHLLEKGQTSLGFMNTGENGENSDESLKILENGQIGLYQKDRKNIVPNGDFSKGIWSQFDCTNPNEAELQQGEKKLDGKIEKEGDYGEILQLTAQNQTACNQIDFAIEPNQYYAFEFEFATNGKGVSFLMGSNDPDAKVIRGNIQVERSNRWQKHQQIFKTWDNTTRTNILLTNKSPGEEIVSKYDNFQLNKLNFINSFDIKIPKEKEDFIAISLNPISQNSNQNSNGEQNLANKQNPDQNSSSTKSQLTYDFNNAKFGQNWFKNGDIENGTWVECSKERSKVEIVTEKDDPQDTQPKNQPKNQEQNKLADSIEKITRDFGGKTMKLTSVRERACNQTNIAVESNTKVLLSFDYKTNNTYISNYLAFDGTDLIINNPFTFTDNTNWNTFTKILRTPNDTSIATYNAYSVGDPNRDKEMIASFDNFKMTPIPDFDSQFFLVAIPKTKLEIPTENKKKTSSLTQKEYNFQNVQQNFFISTRDSFDPNWKLTQKRGDFIQDYLPFARENITEMPTFETNLSQTTWYVDLDIICKNGNRCEKTADGGYNLDLVVEYWPQRWLNLGLIISVFIFISAFVFFLYLLYAKKID